MLLYAAAMDVRRCGNPSGKGLRKTERRYPHHVLTLVRFGRSTKCSR